MARLEKVDEPPSPAEAFGSAEPTVFEVPEPVDPEDAIRAVRGESTHADQGRANRLEELCESLGAEPREVAPALLTLVERGDVAILPVGNAVVIRDESKTT